jgi:hypothetical protein
MLEDSLKRLLRERQWLFRGTSSTAYAQRNGVYFGTRTREGYSTSCTLSILYAMIYAVREADKRDGIPVLLAINSHPYISRIEKGVEWKPFRTWEGIVLHDEYVIRAAISKKDIIEIEDEERFRKYAGFLSNPAFERLARKFRELQE